MRNWFQWPSATAAICLICLTLPFPAVAQNPLSKALGLAGAQTTTNTSASSPDDPLGRKTPRGTVFGFLRAAQAGNYSEAADYLQLTPTERKRQGEQLAQELLEVTDTGFNGKVNRISDSPEGSAEIGVPPGHERVGTLTAGDVDTDFVLIQVTDPEFGKIWLIAAETVSKVPELYSQTRVSKFESHLPSVLVQNRILEMPLWQWLGMIALIPVALGLAWGLIQLAWLPIRLWERGKKGFVAAHSWKEMSGSLLICLTVVLDRIGIGYLSIPLLQRAYYGRFAGVMFVIGFAWLAWRILQRVLTHLQHKAIAMGRRGAGSLVLLGQSILKVLLVLFVGLLVFRILGFDMTTALAGVGIGGIAIALGAQKTIENLIGGLTVLGDEVIHVGDICKIGDRTGEVVDISLRSTRLLTAERTMLSIPNGSLATMNVENLTRRDKFPFSAKFGLRYETSAGQLRAILADARRMFQEQPKVERGSAQIRFSGFSDSALILESSCNVLTTDDAELAEVREEIMLKMMDIVAASGTDFAMSSRRVYLAHDHGSNQNGEAAEVDEIRRWRGGSNIHAEDSEMPTKKA